MGGKGQRSSADCGQQLSCLCKGLNLQGQSTVGFEIRCPRHASRQYYHFAAVVISILKQDVCLNENAVHSQNFPLASNGYELRVYAGSSEPVSAGQRLDFFEARRQMDIYCLFLCHVFLLHEIRYVSVISAVRLISQAVSSSLFLCPFLIPFSQAPPLQAACRQPCPPGLSAAQF